MRFSEFVKTSTLDWKDMVVSIAKQSDDGNISEDDVFAYLTERKGMIDGLLLEIDESDRGTIPIIKRARSLGLKIGIITCGKHPDSFEDLVGANYVDHAVMNIDSPNMDVDMRTTVSIILEYGLSHEFRTVLDSKRLDVDGVKEISRSIKGARSYALMMPKKDGFKRADALKSVESAKGFVKEVRIRQ